MAAKIEAAKEVTKRIQHEEEEEQKADKAAPPQENGSASAPTEAAVAGREQRLRQGVAWKEVWVGKWLARDFWLRPLAELCRTNQPTPSASQFKASNCVPLPSGCLRTRSLCFLC